MNVRLPKCSPSMQPYTQKQRKDAVPHLKTLFVTVAIADEKAMKDDMRTFRSNETKKNIKNDKRRRSKDRFAMICIFKYVCIVGHETRNAYQANASPLRQSTLQDQWYNGRRAFERRLKGRVGGNHWCKSIENKQV